MDALILARIQFAANISFHILFPTITIALGWFLLFAKVRYSTTGNDAWMAIYRFWVKIFALSFGVGVVSGITMSFQFGTNWPGFMETVGNVAGPLLAYEVLTAFFLEAAFLGIMLFGHNRVSNRVHTAATFLVAFGTTMSAFWILVLNSWMHTPQGHVVIDGIVHAVDWWAIVFNPSMPYRLIHMLLASGLTVAFLIAGVSALRWLWGDRQPGLRKAMKMGVYTAALLIPVQILMGDMHGLNTLEHQPAKVAAMEANWETEGRVPLVLFALPDEEARENDFEIAIPGMASLILKHDLDGVVPGLNDFVAEDGTPLHPPVAPVFFAFRVMVGVGVLMLLVSWVAAYTLFRRGEPTRPVAVALVGMTLAGWVATLSGWYVTEIGRQPWLVTGVLTTEAAAAPHPVPILGLSLALYLAVYAGLIVAYLGAILHLAKKASRGGDRDLPPNAVGPMPIPAE
jgi:cytochrome d ubiquinol oxidase subunit I